MSTPLRSRIFLAGNWEEIPSAAAFAVASNMCPYRSRVIALFEWPSILDTIATSVPSTTAAGYAAPGGTIYMPGASTIYYPQGTDWGTSRRADKACIDVLAYVLGLDAQSTTKGDAWGQLHAQAALDMQARFTTGQTYDPADDDAYAGREEWVTLNMARAWLALFLKHREVLVGNWLP